MENKAPNEGRRDKLVRAASQVIHRQGYMRTTLADIAQEAEVALGSVYYYFKSKDDIAIAISERRVAHLDRILIRATEPMDPLGRLHALIQLWVGDKEIDAQYGCPIGSLCYELAKQHNTLSDEANKPLKVLLQWAGEQFRLLGKGEESPSLALHMITVLQGASLVANALNDPAVIVQETDRLKAWLN
ncbi:MAG: TetR/AcrR family transcriptional regulator [Thiobacillus sp.]